MGMVTEEGRYPAAAVVPGFPSLRRTVSLARNALRPFALFALQQTAAVAGMTRIRAAGPPMSRRREAPVELVAGSMPLAHR